ncbi:hypothetical protein K7432_016090 [Basidiobolus ranarum]|uniref:RING-type E3 ubiquitin transferase n=1 Tax=Basidiobolus ranarum TaxID=34480 RepID=A0ABR2WF90_9FUNG
MLIPVEEDGTPIDHADIALLNDSNTNIVYAPPNFNYRLILFLFLMWLSGSIFGCSLLITPLLVGRFILGKLMHNFSIIHDGYSFFAGLYFIWGCLLALEWTLRKVVAYYNWNGDFGVFKRTCKDYVITFFKLVYVFVTLGVIIPCLMSLAVQLYVVYPLLRRQPSRIPVFLLQNWAIGVIYAKIAYQLVFILPENRWSRAINQITQGRGLRNPDIKAITRSLILPIGGTALIAVLAPAFFAYATERYQGSTEVLANSDTYRLAYPLTLVIVTCYFVQKKSISLYHQWMGSIRDEEYVIGRKLENFQRVSKIDSISNHEPEVSTVAKEDQDNESDESDEYDESEPLLGNSEANFDPSGQSTSAGPSDFAQAHASESSPVQSHGQSTTEPALVQED